MRGGLMDEGLVSSIFWVHINIYYISLSFSLSLGSSKSHAKALRSACREGHVEVVKCLIEHYGNQININDQGHDGYTAVMHAFEHGSIDVINTLLDQYNRPLDLIIANKVFSLDAAFEKLFSLIFNRIVGK